MARARTTERMAAIAMPRDAEAAVEAVRVRLRERYAAMQVPGARDAMQAAFDAGSEELGEAAVWLAQADARRRP